MITRQINGPWGYSGNPKNSDKDAVRFTIGDINENDKQLGDCEIEWELEQQNDNVLEASICCVLKLIAYYSRDFDNETKSMSAQVAENYRKLLKDLENRRNTSINTMYSGGLTTTDKKKDRDNKTKVQPMFTRVEGDNPRDSRQYT